MNLLIIINLIIIPRAHCVKKSSFFFLIDYIMKTDVASYLVDPLID